MAWEEIVRADLSRLIYLWVEMTLRKALLRHCHVIHGCTHDNVMLHSTNLSQILK